MQIGPYRLSSPVILAPMAGVTDLPFRRLCRQFGAGLAVSEMISASPALQATRKSRLRQDHRGEPGPISVQIVGADPREMAEAARRTVDLGADIIDINMGCPAKKVCNVAAGSALLRDEKLVANILEAVVQAVPVPVTLKIRTGWDSASRNAVSIGKIAESAGIRALTVHGRTRACGFAGAAEYSTITEVKKAIGIPVIANGDIDSPGKAEAVLRSTGADAVMIGRGAWGRPWLLREIDARLKDGRQPLPPTLDEIRRTVLGHLEALYSFYGEKQGVRIARKHIGWYAARIPGLDDRLVPGIFSLANAPQQLSAVEALLKFQFEKTAA
ncbi:TIM-barrel protein, yjbN family [Methylococcus capsulatus str. Bath]|jgi:tRNA-dihydrouridine synthase B|uniref:tRNA-dihydrouridine synthase B n=2 Tax=Methylococcus capsulatus TaxID=414 RepID=Q607L4_METCA|nr:tRNA dihydrouridine synthase DusB [Methylococcus capsulatus]AAU91971.1 TIM-barrel protein, yjbN family [Methylococcus capsulatus str. Bath]CAI8872068.1 tRNA-dihydrouridine synthase B [Methylococcus capsulatus]